MRALLVAETDSFYKYARALEQQLDAAGIECSIAIIDGPLAPTDAQMTQVATHDRAVERLSARAIVDAITDGGAEWTFLLATGPVVAYLSGQVRRRNSSARLASLTPGVALPERARAMRARQFTDLYVVHSRLEALAFERLIASMGLDTAVALTSLPLINGLEDLVVEESLDCVFAAQPSVPDPYVDRIQLLMTLGSTYGRVGVKVRTVGGAGAQTHDEPFPYGPIIEQINDAVSGELIVIEGSMRDALKLSENLITVSSTAALEAIAAGRRVRIVDDFGVSTQLINRVFIGSDLLGRASKPPTRAPNPAWLEMNYFHDPARNTLLEVLEHTPQRRWSLRPAASRSYAKAVAQGYRKLSSLPAVRSR